jgi:capsular polysaccharide biosynthesis protein
LRTIVAREGGSWDPQPGDSQVDYVLPAGASDEIRELFRPLSSVLFESDYIARLPGGRVFGPGAVLSADGKSIARDVSVDFGKPFQQHWLLGFQKINPPVPLSGTTVVIATALGAGYSHWLLEELPRLLALSGVSYETVIAHVKNGFSREALALSQISATVVEAKRYSHFGCEHLVVPSLIGQAGFPTPKVARLLDEFTTSIRGGPVLVGERLYLSREKARRRRITNDDELWPWLQSRGFVKLCTEDLSWADQIEVFRGAKVVVAPHGAGLANIVFCRPGTKVIELFNRSYVNGCYWRLASVRALDYQPIVPSGPEPLAVDLRANRFDITADLRQVAKALSG